MSISQITTLHDKDTSGEFYSLGEVEYICARNRHKAYDVVLRYFVQSGLTQSALAKRVKMDTSVISRILARPRNIEIDTLSKLIYALAGASLEFSAVRPEHFDSRAAKNWYSRNFSTDWDRNAGSVAGSYSGSVAGNIYSRIGSPSSGVQEIRKGGLNDNMLSETIYGITSHSAGRIAK